MRTPIVFMALGLTVLAAGCASLSSHPPHATDLSGDWKLDPSLSDDPHGLMRQQRQHFGHGMHRPGGMGGMGGGRRGPNGEFLAKPATLTIHQSTRQLELVADGVSTDFVYGEKVMASVKGGAAERSSGWKGPAFIVKYDVSEGPKAARSYELNDGGKQLVVTTQVQGEGGPSMKFRTVYERASAS